MHLAKIKRHTDRGLGKLRAQASRVGDVATNALHNMTWWHSRRQLLRRCAHWEIQKPRTAMIVHAPQKDHEPLFLPAFQTHVLDTIAEVISQP